MRVEISNINEFCNIFANSLPADFDKNYIRECLYSALYSINQNCKELTIQNENEKNYVTKFFIAKKIEGLSEKSLQLYLNNLRQFRNFINKDLLSCNTDDVRFFLADQIKRKNSDATILNKKRSISSFYNFCVQEELMEKNPVAAIKTIKTRKKIQQPIDDMNLEALRDLPMPIRDRAIIELLLSTGMRVGELVQLNINDIDFENKQLIVLGKGNKERLCFLNARAIFHIQKYLKTRDDDNEALFVSLQKPHDRLEIAGVEIFIRKLGRKIGLRIHPHKFRRTAATEAITKGMPIEQVQVMLGHNSISTTTIYAKVKQETVKETHNKLMQ